MKSSRLNVIDSVHQVIENIDDFKTRKACELFFDERSSNLADETIISEKRLYKILFKKFQHISFETITAKEVI